jgi:hypothetical protein
MIRLFILLLLSGCIQDYNSSSGDRERFGKRPTPTRSGNPEDERFGRAFTIISNNCLSCHFGFHNRWASNTTDNAWKISGLVIPGDPFSSRLITKLQNIGGNMPFQSPPLSEDDFNTLVEWINLME